MCFLWRSPMTRSPEPTSGDFIFNLAIAYSGNLEIGTRQLNNWRLHVPPDFLPFCQPGAFSTRLHCSRMPRHHTRPPGRYRFHHLRGLFPKHIIIPKQIFPTWSIYRTSFSEIPIFTNAKSCLPFSSTFSCKNKLTLLYAGIQNSWRNSLQLEDYDANQKDVVNRKNGQGPNHLKFFLLVFSKDEAQAQSPSPKPKKPKSIP